MNERIRELRKAMGKSQEEFGKIIGITKSGVCDIESGRRSVTEQHIIMLKSQRVSENWLRTGEGEMFLKESRNDEIAHFVGSVMETEDDSFKKRLISALVALDENGWDVLEKFIDSIPKKEG